MKGRKEEGERQEGRINGERTKGRESVSELGKVRASSTSLNSVVV